MTAHDDDAPGRDDEQDAGHLSAFDLPDDQFEQFNVELERIFGPTAAGDEDRPSRKMMWLLPAPTFEEAMALLREVPSGSGEAGLNRLLLERFPALAESDDDDPWADAPEDEIDEDEASGAGDATGGERAGG